MNRANRVNVAALGVVILLSIAIAATGNLDSLVILSIVTLLTWIDTRLTAVLAGRAAEKAGRGRE